MPKVPRLSGADAVRAFKKAGFYHARTCGSHFILQKEGHALLLSIPVHQGKTAGTGLLKSQIEAAGLEFIAFL